MKNIILIIILGLFCTSCFIHKGQMINGQCRPKNQNFKLLKIPFKESEKLAFKKIYLSDSNVKSFGIGFYPNGRLVYFVSNGDNNLIEKDVIDKNWNNAMYIGYWRAEKDEIKIQYFVCGNSGVYLEKQGEIKGDTLIFYNNIYSPTSKDVREERYVLSDMSLE